MAALAVALATLLPLSVSALSAVTTTSAAAAAAAAEVSCEDVHIFLARGSLEKYPGRQIAVVHAICNATIATSTKSCGYEDIIYPALFVTDYCDSLLAGVYNGTHQVLDYAAACPNSQLVLSGYSQGAQVFGNVLGRQVGGSEGCPKENNTGFPERPGGLEAVVLFGDPTHVANQTYNTASGSPYDSIWPREDEQLDRFNEYSEVLQSWCLRDDPLCAGGDDLDAHHTYFDLFASDAGEWVLKKLIHI